MQNSAKRTPDPGNMKSNQSTAYENKKIYNICEYIFNDNVSIRFVMCWGPRSIKLELCLKIRCYYPGGNQFWTLERSGEVNLWLLYIKCVFSLNKYIFSLMPWIWEKTQTLWVSTVFILPRTMLRVSFSLVPGDVVADCWESRSFDTRPKPHTHQPRGNKNAVNVILFVSDRFPHV